MASNSALSKGFKRNRQHHDAVHPGHVHVQHHAGDRGLLELFLQERQSCLPILSDKRRISSRSKAVLQALAEMRIVIDDEQSGSFGALPAAGDRWVRAQPTEFHLLAAAKTESEPTGINPAQHAVDPLELLLEVTGRFQRHLLELQHIHARNPPHGRMIQIDRLRVLDSGSINRLAPRPASSITCWKTAGAPLPVIAQSPSLSASTEVGEGTKLPNPAYRSI